MGDRDYDNALEVGRGTQRIEGLMIILREIARISPQSIANRDPFVRKNWPSRSDQARGCAFCYGAVPEDATREEKEAAKHNADCLWMHAVNSD